MTDHTKSVKVHKCPYVTHKAFMFHNSLFDTKGNHSERGNYPIHVIKSAAEPTFFSIVIIKSAAEPTFFSIVLMNKLSYPITTFGYLILNHAASIPPYEPPKAITGLFAAPGVLALMNSISSAKSARACSDVR